MEWQYSCAGNFTGNFAEKRLANLVADASSWRRRFGARQAADLQAAWQSLAGKIDARRHREVAERLSVQVVDSAKWRDHVLGYFQRFSGLPIEPA